MVNIPYPLALTSSKSEYRNPKQGRMTRMPKCPSLAERREARQLPRGRVCETKPISERRQGRDGLATGTPPGVTTSEAAVRNKANCQETGSRQSDDGSCKTKPNLGGMGHLGKSECRGRGGSAGEWSVRNKANSSWAWRETPYGVTTNRAGRAKQSQFPDRREGSPILHGGLVGIPAPDQSLPST